VADHHFSVSVKGFHYREAFAFEQCDPAALLVKGIADHH